MRATMEKVTYQFVATSLASGAVSRDGKMATLEFDADGERMWVTLPTALNTLAKLVAELESLGDSAKSGVARCWHVSRHSKS